MKTNGNEFFYAVQGLMIPKHRVSDFLLKDLEFFVDWVQNNTDKYNSHFENYLKWFVWEMKMLEELLECIYAKWLRNDVIKIIKLAEANKISICQKLLDPFIVNIQMLAIDIQMAQNNKAPNINKQQQNELMNYKDIVSSMTIIRRLLKHMNFETVYDIASNISELKESKYAVPFMEGVTSQDTNYLLKLTDEIVDVYTEKIDELNELSTEDITLKKLLIVDDMPEVLSVLSEFLKDYFRVYALSDGKQALDFIDNKRQPDIFLLDIDMPNMNGLELAKNIREREQYKDTPLIFLTSNSARETVLESLKYDAKAFIVKPSSEEVIISKLRSCVE